VYNAHGDSFTHSYGYGDSLAHGFADRHGLTDRDQDTDDRLHNAHGHTRSYGYAESHGHRHGLADRHGLTYGYGQSFADCLSESFGQRYGYSHGDDLDLEKYQYRLGGSAERWPARGGADPAQWQWRASR
jgi:hypothetical protein